MVDIQAGTTVPMMPLVPFQQLNEDFDGNKV